MKNNLSRQPGDEIAPTFALIPPAALLRAACFASQRFHNATRSSRSRFVNFPRVGGDRSGGHPSATSRSGRNSADELATLRFCIHEATLPQAHGVHALTVKNLAVALIAMRRPSLERGDLRSVTPLLLSAVMALPIFLNGPAIADDVKGVAAVKVQDPKRGSIPEMVYGYGTATPTSAATVTASLQRDGQISDILVERSIQDGGSPIGFRRFARRGRRL
jgi:hypothetical protein